MRHVPTCAELVSMGLAHAASWTKAGGTSTYAISPEGHALLGEIMRENALEARAAGAGDWVAPPSSGHLPLELLTGGQ